MKLFNTVDVTLELYVWHIWYEFS